ncbi:hypothetical protein BO99DRAFT_156290 [Aspergillus violaceofuscus CBS 115571]|uniref:Uncharacterized protein n=1 Tax=Aspergillus violaceofuscus (strain CBS 115571) TaxID=1450538 RepID=A0A2V5I5W2_ASPV1|nr:hypothetical protein BO99DRAFT_156290 [Aspergillus violaceofuscus CBS 115571]
MSPDFGTVLRQALHSLPIWGLALQPLQVAQSALAAGQQGINYSQRTGLQHLPLVSTRHRRCQILRDTPTAGRTPMISHPLPFVSDWPWQTLDQGVFSASSGVLPLPIGSSPWIGPFPASPRSPFEGPSQESQGLGG